MPDTPRFSPPANPTNEALPGDGFADVADVSELRRLIRESEAGRLQAMKALAAKNELLTTLAHELRTPLASMLLHAQLLREGSVVDQRYQRRIADSLERAVQQQTELIDQMREGTKHPVDEQSADDLRTPSPWPYSVSISGDVDHPSLPPRRSLDRPGKLEQYDRLKDVRILYIDDDFVTREAVLEVLELTGARIALAASTADGMMALDVFKPHVIVCDLAMPGEDGYAFMRKLRAYEAGRGAPIPVLAFTGLASIEDKRDALAAGFQMYLAKPIDIDRLRAAVAQLVALVGARPVSDTRA